MVAKPLRHIAHVVAVVIVQVLAGGEDFDLSECPSPRILIQDV